MTLTKAQLETLKRAPFVIAAATDDPHDLCRKGLLAWTASAWRLTDAGQAAVLAHDGAQDKDAA
ncbi:MAG TPA: hypothetical protein VK196_06790 [Magnetospirillum sp.]|nr:hypothetical protein [Magnetospirillum sp.]